MKTEAARHTSKALGTLASTALNVNRALEALPAEHPARKEIAESLSAARGLVEHAHEHVLHAAQVLERSARAKAAAKNGDAS